jgi:hypothetical protein
MPIDLGNLLTLIGQLLTLWGAVVAARAVILTERDAIDIGVTRIAGDTDEENLQLTAVKNLLSASKSAQKGLWLVAIGTIFQSVPVASALIHTALVALSNSM